MSPELEYFSGVDFNLFVVFMIVFEERGVSRAATRLHLGQPAVSNSLAKLRALTGDKLFLFRRHLFQPTDKAIMLADALKPFFSGLHKTINA